MRVCVYLASIVLHLSCSHMYYCTLLLSILKTTKESKAHDPIHTLRGGEEPPVDDSREEGEEVLRNNLQEERKLKKIKRKRNRKKKTKKSNKPIPPFESKSSKKGKSKKTDMVSGVMVCFKSKYLVNLKSVLFLFYWHSHPVLHHQASLVYLRLNQVTNRQMCHRFNHHPSSLIRILLQDLPSLLLDLPF